MERAAAGAGLVLGSLAMLLPIQAMLYQRAAVLWSSLPTTFPFYDNPIVGAGFVTGRLTALQVMGKYVALLAWPARLSCDYSWAQIPPAGGGATDWLGLLGWRRRLRRACGCGAAAAHALFVAGAALLVFLPTSNLLFPIGTIMAERFLYLPAIAFAAGVVAAVDAVGKRVGDQRLVPVLLGLIAMAFAARTWVRNLGLAGRSFDRDARRCRRRRRVSNRTSCWRTRCTRATPDTPISTRDRGGGKGAGASERAAGLRGIMPTATCAPAVITRSAASACGRASGGERSGIPARAGVAAAQPGDRDGADERERAIRRGSRP